LDFKIAAHCDYLVKLRLFKFSYKLKVNGPDTYYTATYKETRTAAIYNSKWRTDQQ